MLRASAGAGAGGGDGGGDGGGGVGPGGSVWLRTRPELPPAQCVTLAMATLSLHSLATHVHAPHRSSATHNAQQAPADAADGNEYPAVLKQVSASTCGHPAAGVSCSSFAGVATARGAAAVPSVANPNHATDINTIAMQCCIIFEAHTFGTRSHASPQSKVRTVKQPAHAVLIRKAGWERVTASRHSKSGLLKQQSA